MRYLVGLVILAAWFAGIAIAKGFWSVLFACIFPPYSLYLVMERVVVKFL